MPRLNGSCWDPGLQTAREHAIVFCNKETKTKNHLAIDVPGVEHASLSRALLEQAQAP